MRIGFIRIICLAVFGSAHGAETPASADTKGAYATGKYRNLFAELGKSPSAIQRKVHGVFQQLFHGDPASQAIYYEAGSNSNGPLAYLTDIKHRDLRSEGLSYGMIIAVQLDKKAEFDAIWNWSKTYLYVTETNHPSYGFFAWQARTNGVRMSQFAAPDGEEYYVMALVHFAILSFRGGALYNYHHHYADKGMVFATIGFGLKTSLALGSASFLWIMAGIFGYDTKLPSAAEAVAGYRACSGIVVGVMFAICTGLLTAYQLNKRVTIQTADELAKRRTNPHP